MAAELEGFAVGGAGILEGLPPLKKLNLIGAAAAAGVEVPASACTGLASGGVAVDGEAVFPNANGPPPAEATGADDDALFV